MGNMEIKNYLIIQLSSLKNKTYKKCYPEPQNFIFASIIQKIDGAIFLYSHKKS